MQDVKEHGNATQQAHDRIGPGVTKNVDLHPIVAGESIRSCYSWKQIFAVPVREACHHALLADYNAAQASAIAAHRKQHMQPASCNKRVLQTMMYRHEGHARARETCLELLLLGCQGSFFLSYCSFPVSYAPLLASHNSIHFSLHAVSLCFSALPGNLHIIASKISAGISPVSCLGVSD